MATFLREKLHMVALCRSIISQRFNIFPEPPVYVGSRWSHTINEDGAPVSVVADEQFTLLEHRVPKESGRGEFVIAIEAVLRPPTNASHVEEIETMVTGSNSTEMLARVKSVNQFKVFGSQRGELIVDEATGYVTAGSLEEDLRSEVRMFLTLPGADGQVSLLPVPIEMRVVGRTEMEGNADLGVGR